MYCFAISNGLPDCLPNSRETHATKTIEEANEIVKEAIASFCSDGYAHRAIDFHGFAQPVEGDASMWGWIVAWAEQGAELMRVDGMTEAEWAQEELDLA